MRGEHRSNIKQRTCRICSVVSLSLSIFFKVSYVHSLNLLLQDVERISIFIQPICRLFRFCNAFV